MPTSNDLQRLLRPVLSAPRRVKQLILISGDLVMMVLILHMVMSFRLGTIHLDIPADAQLIIYSLSMISLFVSGAYRTVLRAFDDRQMKSVLASLMGLMVALILLIKFAVLLHIPRTIPFAYVFLLFIWLWASRISIKYLLRKKIKPAFHSRLLIYGAGGAGRQLLASMRDSHQSQVVGFVDDDVSLIGGHVAGVPVFKGADIAKIISSHQITDVLLAMPSTSRQNRRQILDRLKTLQVKVQSLPSINQLIDGKITVSDVREVDIADLLGRDSVPPNQQLLHKNIQGKVVMVTGAGGSIGSELCRQIVQLHPVQLVIFEQCEFALYSIEQELRAYPQVQVTAILGSVLKEERVRGVMEKYHVQTVYHAAAYKHVPLVEDNPFEGVMNNTIGTSRCAHAAVMAKVETFVLISTDKAVRPTNIMGSTKRLAELVCQALATMPNHQTTFCMVRFGNVLGSSGSVVPLFRKQIMQGGPLTVTDPEMTRYFMTIPEAAQLVIQAGAMARGGDVFVLDMGEPVKILELAKKMILLSGLTIADQQQQGDITIEFTGLRPGEKLYEELLIGGDNVQKTNHALIMQSFEHHYDAAETHELLSDVVMSAKTGDLNMLLNLLERYVEGYKRSPALAAEAQANVVSSAFVSSDFLLAPNV